MPKEFKPQHLITLLVLVTVVALLSVAEWTQSKNSEAEQRENFYSQLNSQSSTFERFIKSRIDSLKNELAQTASRHTDSNSSLTSDAQFSAVAWLKKNPEGSASKYKAVWAEANSQTFDPTWLKGLNFSQVKDGETLFVRRIDRNGHPFFAMVMTALAQNSLSQESSLPENAASEAADDRVYLFGALTPNSLSAWADEYVGSSHAVLVFDESGNVVSHSLRQYSNTNLSTDKLVNAAMRSGHAKVDLEYTNLDGDKRIAESLKISGTNLRAAISVPRAAMFETPVSESHPQRGLMIFIGSILVLAAHFAGKQFAKKYQAVAAPRTSAPNMQAAAYEAPRVDQVAPQPEEPLTFEEVEHRTKLNLEEVLAKSAEIRKRLQLDFVESIESEERAHLESERAIETSYIIEPQMDVAANAVKLKVRRPKVSL